MKSFILAALAVAFIHMPLHAETIGADDARIKELADGDRDKRIKASEALIEDGAEAIPALIGVWEHDQQNAHKMADHTLFRIVHKSAGSDSQKKVAQALIGELKAKHDLQTRRTICTLLSFVGDDDSVEALTDALDDTEIRDMARWALIRIPGKKAVQALSERMNTDDVPWRISLIDALAQKASVHAVVALTEQSLSPDEKIRDAALEALARTPDKDAYKAIREALGKDGKNAGALLLRSSDTLYKAGLLEPAEEALTISMMAGLELTVNQQCEQMFGLGRLGTSDPATLLLDEVNNKNPRVRAAAIQASVMLKGESGTTDIARKLTVSETSTKVGLLDVLGERRDTMSKEAAEIIVTAATDKDESVRLAAIGAIGKAGIASGVEVLIKALGEAGPMRDAAEQALTQMPGEAATKEIAKAAGNESPARVTLLVALGRRADVGALPVLKDATQDKDAAIRAAAFTAIGSLQTPDSADILIEGLKGEPGGDYDAAGKALTHLQGDEVRVKMLAAYKDFPDAKKSGLLRVIGRRKHADIVDLLTKESKNENHDIRAAALLGIGHQDDPKVAPILLEAAKQGPAPVTEAAVAAYLRLARLIEDNERDSAGKMYNEAIRLAVNDEQKQQALEGLDRTNAANDIQLLPIIEPLIAHGNGQAVAAKIAARLALQLHDDRKAEIIEVLTAAVKWVPGEDVANKALARLHELGVDIDPARDNGFIVDWWVIGPFPNEGDSMWEKGFFPEQKIDLQASEKIGDTTYSWKKYHSPLPEGAVDLEKAVAAKESVGAYAYCEVVSDKEQDVVLKIGSDDSIVVWVNGQKVHANQSGRPLHIDEDQAKAHLKAGVNKILCKVLNGSASWAFSFHVVTPSGEPIVLKLNPQ